ncbi:hypothetical protein ASPZODRAFT_56749 [Penicilliopsis zonata CBS 506.65]|uniref:RTA1 domain protein n=1 Tax=Penicilliopsis zonata CBS 506.65 TaxID=1073090 RepID=A0A1L9STN5_9EURO|nr:hypothetical protein ASPZODRAFT_56749 [Penicilliopsis zonata CBS 506.65]OJJ50570.1 hypothetical protein ASPZODRAFT_56749 [Penicilliopsis zonata CBS 506.65]
MNVTAAQLSDGCYAYNYDLYGATNFGYVPSLAGGIAFCAIFGVFLLVHLLQTVWKRMWWTLLFSLGAMTELIGWIGRIWAAQCPYNGNAFLMQITTLIIAPTFITAGIYVILGRLIHLAGPHTSPIAPRTYLYIFMTCDLMSLVIQAVGGAMASIASNSVPPGNTSPGTNIMVGGIVFQMAATTVFAVLFVLFVWRSRGDNLPRKIQYLLLATASSTLMIYVRSIYRTIELSQGWTGFLITHEIFFVVLDGIMMVLAIGVFNLVHPAWFGLGGQRDKYKLAGPLSSEESSEQEQTELVTIS